MITRAGRWRGRAVTIVVILAIGVLCRLGIWQLERHAERAQQNGRILAGLQQAPLLLTPRSPELIQALDYRRVTVRGTFDPAHEVLLRNRSLDGATGYHLITPLRLSGSDRVVLIDRGWVPLALADPAQRALLPVPSGEVGITGVSRITQRGGRPADPPLTADRPRLERWFWMDLERMQQQMPYPLTAFYVVQEPDAASADALPRPTAVSDLGAGPHLGYAIQWFSFAIIFAVGYAVIVRRNIHRRTRAAATTGRTAS
jgi:surfeit locus 1 family protein